MTDLDTLKEDFNTMVFYSNWLVPIAKKLKEELSDRWFYRIEDDLRRVLGSLEWMIEECKDEIAAEEEADQ